MKVPQTINEVLQLPKVFFAERRVLPRISAVYFVLDGKRQAFYVGQSKDIRGRWARHHLRKEVSKLENACIYWLEAPHEKLLDVEKTCIQKLLPSFNQVPGTVSTTTKIKPETLMDLKVIAARAGEKQYAVLDRLVKAELKRLEREK